MMPFSYPEMVNLLNYNAKKYYVDDTPEITDEAYDTIYQRVVAYEKEHPEEILPYSPTQRIGHPILSSDLKKQSREIVMGSLENAFTDADVVAFLNTIYMPDSIAFEFKMDGVGLELVYVYGHLTVALTRGDGKTGEVVTHTAKVIPSIPLYIKELENVDLIEIRGEVVMPYTSVEEYKKNNPDKEVVSPRNIAAGALRQLDPRIAADRKLLFIPHSLGKYPEDLILSFYAFNRLCKKWGFRVITTKVFKDIKDIKNLYEKIREARNKLPFAIDGVVLKVNELPRHSVYGSTAKCPRWAVAWKFPSEEKQVILKDVIVDVGRTGVITPVAVFDSVELSSVMVTNATLHNYDDIKKKDICIGDTITVTRSGDVIPKVTGVIKEKRPSDAKLILMPEKCPSCGEPITKTKAAAYCVNSTCRGQAIQRIVHFASRGAMNIQGLGQATAEFCYDELGLTTLYDLVSYNFDQYAKATSREKTYSNLQQAIDHSLDNASSSEVLFALGLPRIGKAQADEIVSFLHSKGKHLADMFKNTEVILSLQEIQGIGEQTVNAVVKYLGNQKILLDILQVLNVCKLNDSGKVGALTSTILQDKTFVITGTLSLPREDVAAYIKSHGGKATTSVSKKTSYLIVGESPGNDKVTKANAYKIPQITENDLYAMVSDN